MPDDTQLRSIVGGVLREALRMTDRAGIVILDDGSPEAVLLSAWCAQEIGARRTWRAGPNGAQDTEEGLRHRARVLARERRALTANAANKTALLLAAEPPCEPLLPLGDLYATQVVALAGGWSAPPEVRHLVDQAGGIEATDGALHAWFEEWRNAHQALKLLPASCRGPFLEAVSRGRFWRERAGLIPKLSGRTIGIDLFA
ncbi:MAG: hypothetical protein ACRENP_23265 [Longimicrobiales bacterium]